MFEFFKALLFIACGAIPSWFGCLAWNGLSLNPFDAAKNTQRSIDAAVVATQGIDASARSTAAAKERVRTVIKTVEVAAECPPGRGAVSPDVARRMRLAFAVERHGTGDVHPGSDGRVPDSND